MLQDVKAKLINSVFADQFISSGGLNTFRLWLEASRDSTPPNEEIRRVLIGLVAIV
jgi:hypothetical protein